MRKQILLAAGAIASTLLVSPAGAAGVTTLTFDNVSPDQYSPEYIPSGYGGLNWSNVQLVQKNGYPGGDFNNGVVSGDWAVYNTYGVSAGFSAVSGTFTLVSADFTAAWYGGTSSFSDNVTVTGFNSKNKVLDRVTFSVNDLTPTLETFDWSGLTSVGYQNSAGRWTVIDNMSVITTSSAVPEMSTWAMLLAGFGALGFAGWRRKSAGDARATA